MNQVNDIILPFERKEGNLIPRVNFLLSNFFNGYGNLKELEIKYISLQEHAEKVKEGIKGLVWTGELSNLTSPAPPSPPKSPIKIRVLDFARGIWNKKRVDALNATLKFRCKF